MDYYRIIASMSVHSKNKVLNEKYDIAQVIELILFCNPNVVFRQILFYTKKFFNQHCISYSSYFP